MSRENTPPPDVRRIVEQLPSAHQGTTDSFNVKAGEGYSEKIVDAIEMIGEETATGMNTPAHSEVSAGMRYLHSSRTIHQLVTDRNRAVGIYLAVASLLLTASGAILHASPSAPLIVPIEEIQRWCLPVTFATLTVLALFSAFLLIRTRVGLIYEVAKMNALLGLPVGRVKRVSPLSIHFIMQALVSLAGGASAALLTLHLVRLRDDAATDSALWIGILVGVLVTTVLIVLDIITVTYTTSDQRLQKV